MIFKSSSSLYNCQCVWCILTFLCWRDEKKLIVFFLLRQLCSRSMTQGIPLNPVLRMLLDSFIQFDRQTFINLYLPCIIDYPSLLLFFFWQIFSAYECWLKSHDWSHIFQRTTFVDCVTLCMLIESLSFHAILICSLIDVLSSTVIQWWFGFPRTSSHFYFYCPAHIVLALVVYD